MSVCDTNIYDYYIHYTTNSIGTISIPKSALDKNIADIAFIGKSRLEYGEVFNENILHLLERFSSPSDNSVPVDSNTFQNLLQNPVVGQLWYNSHTSEMNMCVSISPISWEIIPQNNHNMHGNSGFLFDGEIIPLPVGIDGYVYDWSECVWHVSPAFMQGYNAPITHYTVDASSGIIDCKYSMDGVNFIPGHVTYIILGKKDSHTIRII